MFANTSRINAPRRKLGNWISSVFRYVLTPPFSWIGSVQLCIILSVGLFSGRAFDAGYLYVFRYVLFRSIGKCLKSTLSDSYHLMIGGFVLFEFCLFMISISKPEQYYQVIGLYHLQSGAVSLTYPKLFLAQGFGMGIATGIMYIPALGIVSHYFQKRRALAIGLATSVGALPLTCPVYNSKDDVGFCIRRGDPPHHAKRMVSRHSRISLGRQS